MKVDRQEPGKRIGTKAIAAKVLLEQGESIRSTADALGLSKGTVHALSNQQILTDAQLTLIERSNREKAARVEAIGLDILLENNAAKLRKCQGPQLAAIVKDMKKIQEGDKPNTTLFCNTLIATKYGISTPQVIDNPHDATT